MRALEPRGASDPTPAFKTVPGTRAELIAWIVLNMVPAHFGIPLLLGTILLVRNIRRLPVFINMCVVWILNGVFSCLLVYSGHTTGPEPPKSLCLVQAALLNGIPPAASLSVFFVVFQLFVSLKSALRNDASQVMRPLYAWIMLISPHAAIVVAAAITVKIGVDNPGLISRRELYFYCNVHSNALSTAVFLFSSAVLVGTLFFEVWTVIILFRRGRLLRADAAKGGVPLDFPFIIRVALFTGYVLLGLCVCVITTFAGGSAAQDIMVATLSWAFCFTFCSQRDILKAWASWRYKGVANGPPM